MRKKPALWVALFLLMVAGLGATAWRQWGGTWPARATEQSRSTAPAASPGNQFAIPVEGVPVTVATLTSEIHVIGSLHSNESVVIRPEIGGRVATVLFEEGQRVTTGTPLIKLDQTIALAEVHQAEAALELSRANHQRTTELFERKAASAANRDQTLAALRADQANLELAQARLAKLTLTAPFDGVLGLRKVSVGDYVTPGQDIVNLEDIEPLKVEFRIPERYLGSLSVGQTVAVTADAFQGRSFAGQVYAIDPLVDENGRAVVLRARLPNQEGVLRPGLFVSISLVVGERENAVLIPEQALVPQGSQQLVFKVADGKAVLTPVKLGERRNAMVEIVQGLARGDVVVTAGQIKLRDGVAVTVQPPPPES
jgi:membrane fusion protein (multidrug efflux system)